MQSGTTDLIGTAGDDTLTGTDRNDTIKGGEGDDSLIGGVGNDYLNGNAGADTLIGGESNDILDSGGDNVGGDFFYGGAGDDIYGVHNNFTTIIENSNEGNDTVWTAANYTLTANVEILYLVGALTGNGTITNNMIIGYGADYHLINGLDGNDYLIGGVGKDTITRSMGAMVTTISMAEWVMIF